jgi:hypothetical protein
VPKEGLISFSFRPTDAHTFQSGFLDSEFNEVIPPKFQSVTWFQHGLAIVQSQEFLASAPGQYIDKTGKLVAPYINAISLFNDAGLAVASLPSPTAPKLGLINEKFEFIVSPVYDQLEQVAKKIYAAKTAREDHYIAINQEGKRLFDFPESVIGFGPYEETRENEVIVAKDSAPPDKGGLPRNCVFDTAGKLIVPPKYYVTQSRYGLLEICEGTIVPDRKFGLMDSQGNWLVPLEMAYFAVTEPDRVIKTVRNSHFDSEAWKDSSYNHVNDFAHFLKDYDLIGMSYERVRELLGRGQEVDGGARYYLLSGSCGNSWTGFDIDFEDRKVKRWRFSYAMNQHGDWVTQDMIFNPEADPLLNRQLIPKTSLEKRKS